MSDSKIIAQTILQQLGGNRFIAMTGAKNLTSHGPEGADRGALSLRFPKPRGAKVNYLKITLTGMDTYVMTFGYIRGLNFTPATPITDAYAEDLQEIFTKTTGLYTHL